MMLCFRCRYPITNLTKSLFAITQRKYGQRPIDPYKLLGVSRNATDEEIKRAQRKLAKQFHPDVNKAPDANQKFQDIQAAYDMIKDKESREQTEYRSSFGGYGGGGGGGYGGGGGGGYGGGGYGEYQGYQTYQKQQKSRNYQKRDMPQWENMSNEQREQFKDFFTNFLHKNHRSYKVHHQNPFENYEFHFVNNSRSNGFIYTALNFHTKFPQDFTLRENFLVANYQPEFKIFSRGIAFGSVSLNSYSNRFEWKNQIGDIVAYATAEIDTKASTTFWMYKEISIFSPTSPRKIYTIRVKHLKKFSFFSRSVVYDKQGKEIMKIIHNGLFGTRIYWHVIDPRTGLYSTLGAYSIRGLVDFFGRVFDLSIRTRHDTLHPAVYLFSLLSAHKLDIDVSPVRQFGSSILRKLTSKFEKK